MGNNESLLEQARQNTGVFFTDDEREQKIKKERNRLRRIIKDEDKDKKSICYPLIDNIAFSIVQLEELREMVKKEGYYSFYQNGKNQWGQKKSISSEMILQVGKNYVAYLNKLKEFLPEGTAGGDALAEFDRNHKI